VLETRVNKSNFMVNKRDLLSPCQPTNSAVRKYKASTSGPLSLQLEAELCLQVGVLVGVDFWGEKFQLDASLERRWRAHPCLQ